MLIKIDCGVYINPDHVFKILFLNNGYANVYNIGENSDPDLISPAAAAYLMDIMETSQAITFPGEPGYVDPSTTEQPLTSRLAQLLRHEFMQGATVDELMEYLDLGHDETYDTLGLLIKERVVILGETPGGNARYWHATHFPRRSDTLNPENSTERA